MPVTTRERRMLGRKASDEFAGLAPVEFTTKFKLVSVWAMKQFGGKTSAPIQ